MRLLIAGGGTGGHLFPAMAIARAIKAEDPGSRVLFVGTRHGIEARLLPDSEFPVRFITARGMRRTGIVNMLRASIELPLAILQSMSIVREFRPDFVLGVGGYASGPTLIAAILMRIPNAVQEQNSVMGTTNRILSRFTDRVYISWENTEPTPPPGKTLLTGNPIRADLLQGSSEEVDPTRFNVLVFGGSRGARSINVSLARTLDLLASVKDKIKIVHQTGMGEAEELRNAYERAGIDSDVREFIHDMGPVYRWADLVVCRSGASTLAELTALGKPAIVIPYPYAIGDHQARNAQVLEEEGAVRVVRDDSLQNGALVKEILSISDTPEVLKTMAQNSRKLGRPDAARTIALDILRRKRSEP